MHHYLLKTNASCQDFPRLFLQEFDVSIVGQRDIRATIEEFILHPPFREKGRFLWLAGVWVVVWDIWGKRNDTVFRGRDRDPCEA